MYQQSLKWTDRALKVIPGGACTLSKRPGVAGPAGSYPAYLESGDGCRVTDVDARSYVDWTSALGANLLGNGEEIFSLPSIYEVELAEALVEVLPGAEQVKFASTGTEACMAAMATARAATGRLVIVTSDQSYHGWSDHYRAVKIPHPGVPQPMTEWITTFRYNDLADLDRVLALHAGNVAAVMMEPALVEPPIAGFLPGVKDRAHGAGALLVFDEMLLGGRLALGGGSAYFNVTPDLATYGKAFGMGFPLGILCGAAKYMAHALFMSGTFCGHPEAMQRGLAAVDLLREQETIPALHDIGKRLVQLIRGAIVTAEVPLSVVGYPVLPVLKWTVPDPDLLLQSLLQQELADRGVLIHASGRLLPQLTHDDAALIETGKAFQEALLVVSTAWRSRDLRERLRGEPVRQSGIRQPAWEVPGGSSEPMMIRNCRIYENGAVIGVEVR